MWEGHIDVASDALSAGVDVGVLYHRVGRSWYEVDGVPPAVRDPALPLQHFSFELWHGVSSGSEGGANWQNMKIEVIPFLRMVDGSRVFDHNIVSDDFTNYTLDYGWGTGRSPFVLETDPTRCVR